VRQRVAQGMTTPRPAEPPDDDLNEAEALIDQEAAEIDARAPDAPERIAELVEEADELGLPTRDLDDLDAPDPDDR